MERWPDILELALIVAVLLLRRIDVRSLRTVATKQGALVEIVRSSLRPPPQRCGDCAHEQGDHTGPLGEQGKCAARWCRCPQWIDPPAPIVFEDATPTLRKRTQRPEGP